MLQHPLSGTSPLAGEAGRGGAQSWMAQLAIAFAIVLSLLTPATAAEEIITYDVAVVLAPDASAEVTETITANVEGRQILRGLLRYLPKSIVGDDASIREVTNTVLSATRDGAPEPYAVEDLRGQIVIRIGKVDVFLAHKVHTWTLRYRISAIAGPSGSHNALAYEAIGMNWPFPIRRVNLTVTLPPGSRVVKPVARIGTAVGDLAGRWTNMSPTKLSFTPLKPVGDDASLSVVVLFTGGLTP